MPDVLPLTSDDILKLSLLTDGAYVEPLAANVWRESYGGPLTLAEHATTGGIILVLPGGRFTNVIQRTEPDQDALRLSHDGNGFVVRGPGTEVPVDVVPVARYHQRQLVDRMDGRTRPMHTYGVTHSDRCRVSPIAGCAWNCRFCDLPWTLDYRKKHVDDLLEVIEAAALDDQVPARHVMVSGGTPRRGAPVSDEDWIDDVYAELAERSPLPVEVMMAARRDLDHPVRLHKAGVSALSINLEVSDLERARLLAPQKAGFGREHVLDYIERAVEVFGVGNVQSLIVVGAAVEPPESTLRGIRDLVARGCIPVLSPFRPHPATPMRDAPAATAAELLNVYLAALDICERAGGQVLPGPRCVACHHNVVAFPLPHPMFVRTSTESAVCAA
jgi:hypothetical protein